VLRGINHITLAVSDLNQSINFYTKTLGMKPHVKWKRGAYLSLAEVWFCLSLESSGVVNSRKDDSHIAFDIDELDFNRFVKRLKTNSVTEWKVNTSEGRSLYFLDPDGHKLEVHCGNLQSRLKALKADPYEELEWY